MTNKPVRVRFAPSPTGRLHLGNLRPALLNYFFARRAGGEFILRYDDTDTERSTQAFAEAMGTDLAWLGLKPDLVVRQSDRTALYEAARDKLIADGRLYPAYETAEELDRKRARARALGRPPLYDRAALDLSANDRKRLEEEGRRPHWRFKLMGEPVVFRDLIRGEQTVNTGSMSDPVLIREDGSYLYTLPSVVDDIDLGVSHVIRGEDHVSNTGVQIELFEALGGNVPQFAHHNLLTDETGAGLSKRLGSLSLGQLREQGYEPMAIVIMAALTGTSLPLEPYKDLEEIAQKLEFSAISHGPARYSPAELEALNARILHNLEFDEVRERLAEHGLDDPQLWRALRDNLGKFDDIVELADMINAPARIAFNDEDRHYLQECARLLPQEPWDETTWSEWTGRIKAETGRKGKALFHPLRLALTGREQGPELKTLLPLLGRKASLDRLA